MLVLLSITALTRLFLLRTKVPKPFSMRCNFQMAVSPIGRLIMGHRAIRNSEVSRVTGELRAGL